MLEFLSANWVWILLVGGMLFMHFGHGAGHGGGHGGHAGCGGHQHSGTKQSTAQDDPLHQHHDHAP
jgi:hypothetical protein